MMKACNEPVDDPDAPQPAPPKPKRKTSKVAKRVVASNESDAPPILCLEYHNVPGPVTRR